MRNRIRLLALAVVAIGGGTLATPSPAYATWSPPPQYCCCEIRYGRCANRCCSTFGCSVSEEGCVTLTIPQ
jgi:hypothetical protein